MLRQGLYVAENDESIWNSYTIEMRVRELFDAVQEMIDKNIQKRAKRAKSKKYDLTGKISCGYCGWLYKRRIQNGIAYWVCSHDGVAGQQCKTKPLSEEVFFKTFVNFYNRLRFHENLILRSAVTKLTEIKKIITCTDSKIGEIDKEIAKLTERYNFFTSLAGSNRMDAVSFAEECSTLERDITKLKSARKKLLNEDEDERCIDEIRILREKFVDAPMAILQFDADLFNAVVEKAIVEDENKVSFVLRCGLKLREAIAWN